jgi:hypothetical protein
MSGESYPTLSGAIPAFETFMSAWEKMIKEKPNLKPLITPGLEWAYKYYARMDRTKAYIIAMCEWIIPFNAWITTHTCIYKVLNPTMRMEWIHAHWDRSFIDKAETAVWEVVS